MLTSHANACRAHNGGLIDLRELRRHVVRRRGSAADPVSTDDIVQVQGTFRRLTTTAARCSCVLRECIWISLREGPF